MDIRLAKGSDLAQAAGLWYERAAVLQQSSNYLRLAPDSQKRWQDQAQAWLVDERYGFFVAVAEKAVVGYIVIGCSDGMPGLEPIELGKVVDMAVDLHRPYRGLGGRLLARARVWLQAKDIKAMTVDVPMHYPVEEAFWRAQGASPRFNRYWLKL